MTAVVDSHETTDSALCARCAVELRPGIDIFYQVTIEAIADPTPPVVTAADLTKDLRHEIKRLAESMKDLSEQEAMDQVYRRLTLFLCGPCYCRWIENPAGSVDGSD